MKYLYKISRPQPQAFSLDQLSEILPKNFSYMEEEGHLLLVVEPQSDLTDEQVFNQVQQECDRLYFLTGMQLNPKLVRKEYPNGSIEVSGSQSAFLHGIKPLPAEIDRQDWDPSLPVQLRLWQLAHSENLPIASQINLLFQIIEISYGDTRNKKVYPRYNDPASPPHPLTEAKLLRHLASHGKLNITGEVKNYYMYKGIQAESHDPTDVNIIRILYEGLSLVENEAQKIIDQAITQKPREAYKEVDL